MNKIKPLNIIPNNNFLSEPQQVLILDIKHLPYSKRLLRQNISYIMLYYIYIFNPPTVLVLSLTHKDSSVKLRM